MTEILCIYAMTEILWLYTMTEILWVDTMTEIISHNQLPIRYCVDYAI